MKAYISKEMQAYLRPRTNAAGQDVEEAVDQPLYHRQNVASTDTKLTFFNSTSQDETVTNVTSSELSKGRRFAIFGVSVVFIAGQNYAQDTTNQTLSSALNDAKRILESAALLRLTVLQKDYLVESPLTRVPSGIGLWSGAGGFNRTQLSAADGTQQISYATNGMPMFGCSRKLRIPIPLPEQTKFKATIEFAAAQSNLTVTGELMVHLDGVTLRAIQ